MNTRDGGMEVCPACPFGARPGHTESFPILFLFVFVTVVV